jgi:uncharacterized membrane-anchored protein
MKKFSKNRQGKYYLITTLLLPVGGVVMLMLMMMLYRAFTIDMKAKDKTKKKTKSFAQAIWNYNVEK